MYCLFCSIGVVRIPPHIFEFLPIGTEQTVGEFSTVTIHAKKSDGFTGTATLTAHTDAGAISALPTRTSNFIAGKCEDLPVVVAQADTGVWRKVSDE